MLSYVKKWIPHRRVGVLAGNSVHADRAFLVEEMPDVIDWLHYRYAFRSAARIIDYTNSHVFILKHCWYVVFSSSVAVVNLQQTFPLSRLIASSGRFPGVAYLLPHPYQELSRRWYPSLLAPPKGESHRYAYPLFVQLTFSSHEPFHHSALDDIKASIQGTDLCSPSRFCDCTTGFSHQSMAQLRAALVPPEHLRQSRTFLGPSTSNL